MAKKVTPPKVETLKAILLELFIRREIGRNRFGLCHISSVLTDRGTISMTQYQKFGRYIVDQNKDFEVMYNGSHPVKKEDRTFKINNYYHWEVYNFQDRYEWLTKCINLLNK